MLAGDQAPSADFDVGQVAAVHLVVEQVAGQARALSWRPCLTSRPAARGGPGLADSRGGHRRAAPGLRYAGNMSAGPRFWSCCRRWVVIVPPRGRACCFPGRAAGEAGGLGGPVDRVGLGQAEFGGPALDEGPEPGGACSGRVRW